MRNTILTLREKKRRGKNWLSIWSRTSLRPAAGYLCRENCGCGVVSLRPVKQCRIKFSRFQLKPAAGPSTVLQAELSPVRRDRTFLHVSHHPTRVSVYRFPPSVRHGFFTTHLGLICGPIGESRHDRRSRPKSSALSRAC